MVIRKHFIFCFVLFFINEVTSSDTSVKDGVKDENKASESAYPEKKGDVAERHQFRQFAGHVDQAGNVKVVIQLASVDTNKQTSIL